jgi:hypothetical protein
MRVIPMTTPTIQAKFPDWLGEEVGEAVGLAGILVVGVFDLKMIDDWFDVSVLDEVIVVEVPVGISWLAHTNYTLQVAGLYYSRERLIAAMCDREFAHSNFADTQCLTR